VVSVAALAALALLVSNTAAVVLLRSYLLNRIDSQLASQSRGFVRPGATSQEQVQDDHWRPPAFGPDSRIYRYDSDGTEARSQIYQSTGETQTDNPDLRSVGDIRRRAADGKAFTIDGTLNSWRALATELPNGRGYSLSAVSLREVEATEEWFLIIDVVVGVLVLLMMGIAAATVVRLGLRPLTRMQYTAAAIAEGDLSQRVSDADPHTEAGQLGTALNAMLCRIEAAVGEQAATEHRLRRLLADAAHELRTPLTSIQGFAELYGRGGAPPGPQLDEAMGRIRSEASRMRLLVNDLLLLARLDEERTLELRPVDLLAVAADAIRDAHARVPTRFVELGGFDDDCETFEPVTVLGDEPRIRQVVTNLVANALQHTPEGARVVVRVGRPDSAPNDQPTVTVGADLPRESSIGAVEVVDTGPGMDLIDATRIFERLYRADPSRSRRHGGAGLGLAIVASIVKSHGGRVELRTAPGAGARFRVLLPAANPAVDFDDR
jgi:two-component system OmpR family sensor kinase